MYNTIVMLLVVDINYLKRHIQINRGILCFMVSLYEINGKFACIVNVFITHILNIIIRFYLTICYRL